MTKPLFDFLKNEFQISLKVWHNIAIEPQDKSVKKISPVLAKLDPVALNSVFQVAEASKSAALGLALILQGPESKTRLSLEQAVNIARVDEQY